MDTADTTADDPDGGTEDGTEDGTEEDDPACAGDELDMADCRSLRRYEPDQVQAVGGRPCATRVATSKPPSQPGGLPRGQSQL